MLSARGVIPEWRVFSDLVEVMFEQSRSREGGRTADYIPTLANVDIRHFAVAICTVDGQRLHLGDFEEHFTLQSTFAPLAYLLALRYVGAEKGFSMIGFRRSP